VHSSVTAVSRDSGFDWSCQAKGGVRWQHSASSVRWRRRAVLTVSPLNAGDGTDRTDADLVKKATDAWTAVAGVINGQVFRAAERGEPILYLSLYFKTHRQQYYELLNRVRTAGGWEAWLEFFLNGIKELRRRQRKARTRSSRCSKRIGTKSSALDAPLLPCSEFISTCSANRSCQSRQRLNNYLSPRPQ
jgi:hypothetical protein